MPGISALTTNASLVSEKSTVGCTSPGVRTSGRSQSAMPIRSNSLSMSLRTFPNPGHGASILIARLLSAVAALNVVHHGCHRGTSRTRGVSGSRWTRPWARRAAMVAALPLRRLPQPGGEGARHVPQLVAEQDEEVVDCDYAHQNTLGVHHRQPPYARPCELASHQSSSSFTQCMTDAGQSVRAEGRYERCGIRSWARCKPGIFGVSRCCGRPPTGPLC